MVCASHEADLMPIFFIQLRDSKYYSRDDGTEHHSAEAALAVGVESAMRLASDEIASGCRSAALEITVERDDGKRLLHSVVALSVSPMIMAEKPDFDEETSIISRF